MKKLILLIVLITFQSVTHAHPGIGIVKDSRGTIYYTDLSQVWKIAKDGSRSIAVAGVHTHELYMDTQDNLFGEHTWYNGEHVNTWGSFAWKLHPNGKFDTVLGPLDGFLKEYSFVRDAKGNQYWSERWKTTRIRKKTPNGEIMLLAEGKFNDIKWMHATPSGMLYFNDGYDLFLIDTTGRLHLVVKDLSRQPDPTGIISRHHIFGIWTDRDGQVYVAIFGNKTIKKVDTAGKVSDFFRSTEAWSPTSGIFDDDGNFWVMEYNNANETRVSKISKNQGKEDSAPSKISVWNNLLTFFMIGVLVVGVSGWMIQKKYYI